MSSSEHLRAAGLSSNAGPGGRRWVVLVAGLFAMTAGCTFQYGLSYETDTQPDARLARAGRPAR